MEKKYIKIETSKLIKNPNNAKLHNDELIQDSINSLGYVDDIVCDENFNILSGCGRYDALTKLGIKEINVIQVIGWTEEEKQRYSLLANKTVESGGWDEKLLSNFSEDALLNAGWKPEELDRIFELDSGEDDFKIEEELEKITEPKVKLGDLYILGGEVVCPKCNKIHKL